MVYIMKFLRYSLILVFLGIVIGGGVYFYNHKDGYLVTFNSNGGSVIAPIRTGIKKQIDVPVSPTREGYTFVGWYLDDEKFDFDLKVEEDITLTAHWEEEKSIVYTLSFDSLGGSVIEDIKIEKGSVLEDVPVPIKEGYLFLYWTYHNAEFSFTTPIDKSMTFVAKYKHLEEEKVNATITFDSNGGSLVEDVVVKIGDIAKMPKEPTKDGYRFAGWYLDDEEFLFLEPVYEDITLQALWEKE